MSVYSCPCLGIVLAKASFRMIGSGPVSRYELNPLLLSGSNTLVSFGPEDNVLFSELIGSG